MDYAAAVQLASEILEGVQELPDEADKLSALVLHFLDNEDMPSLNAVIAASERQALSHEALCRATATCLRQGRTMPQQLSEWAAQAILNPESRPARPHIFKKAWPGEATARNIRIYDAVCALQSHGVMPTHNDASPGGTSGCDAVAEALRQAGSNVRSYRTVLKIYADVKGRIESGNDLRVGVETITRLIKSTH